MGLSAVVVCCWFTGVGFRVSLSVHVRLLVLVVGRHLLVVDFDVDCRSLFPLSVPSSACLSDY